MSTKMARSKAKRYRTYKSGKRYAPNIKLISKEGNSAAGNSTFYAHDDLCLNPVQDPNTVSQAYTVKNIECSFNIETSAAQNIENIVCYIMYVPQGMPVAIADYAEQHPEYIMAMRYIGSPEAISSNNGVRNPLKVKTRLARRLQTGDRVVLYITGANAGSSSATINIHGIVRWWTKAN